MRSSDDMPTPGPTHQAPIDTDVVVIGAGPVGLFQVFQLGLLGLRCELVDVLPEAGGQCVALYPDKPIYDVPGVPVCTGRELAALLLAQAAPFLPPQADGVRRHLHLGQQVSSLQVLSTPGPTGDDRPANTGEPAASPGPRFELHTDQGTCFRARAVVVAAGAGAFVPRALALPGWQAETGPTNLHFHAPSQGFGAAWAGQHIVVAGGGDEALQSALDLTELEPALAPASVTLLHRRDVFQAESALEARVRERIAEGRLRLQLGMVQGVSGDAESPSLPTALTALQLLTPDGAPTTLPLNHLLVRLGLSPKLGPLADWGLALERKQLAVDPATSETATPRLYAVGDISTCKGKKRLLLCGFHEATMAAHHVLSVLSPEAPQHLQYTTTSPVLQQRLGVPH